MTRAAAISSYPSRPAIRRAVDLARELGIDVAGFEVAPGGIIRILGPAAFPAPPKDEFEAWDQAGKLG